MKRMCGFRLPITLAGLALAIVLLAQPGGVAQDKKDDKPAPPKTNTGAITVEELGKIFENLGYEPVLKETKDNRYYLTKVNRDGLDYSLSTQFSGSKEVIWFQIGLATVPDPAPPERILKFLELNSRYGRAFFRYFPNGRMLTLDMPIENYAMTPAKIRKGIDEIFYVAKSTENVWRGDWTKPLANAVAPKAGDVGSGSPNQEAGPIGPR